MIANQLMSWQLLRYNGKDRSQTEVHLPPIISHARIRTFENETASPSHLAIGRVLTSVFMLSFTVMTIWLLVGWDRDCRLGILPKALYNCVRAFANCRRALFLKVSVYLCCPPQSYASWMCLVPTSKEGVVCYCVHIRLIQFEFT